MRQMRSPHTLIEVPSHAVAVALGARLILDMIHFEAEPQDDTTWNFAVPSRYADYVNQMLDRLV